MAQQDQGIDMTDTVELENGCACCTAGGDLMDSILKLIRLSIRRGIKYDRIIVEMSGVSEPKNLRAEFIDCEETHQVWRCGILL
jgi:G3E family GTPase